MPFSHLDYESWRLVCHSLCFFSLFFIVLSPTDTGAEKKELCKRLGAEKWIDFRETKDLVKEIKDATGGTGAHAALISAASVSIFLSYRCELKLY